MTRQGRRGPATAAACALLAVIAAFPPAGASVADQFVTTDGTRLMLGGRPWRAVGVNIWDMDVVKAGQHDLSGCYYQRDDLDAYFDATFERIAKDLRATAVRTFGFRMQYTGAGRDFGATDKLLYYARKHDIRVIPAIGDQWSSCGTPFKTPEWYHCTHLQPATCKPGYKQREQAWLADYRSYVVEVVSRYKDDPTIAFWQLMNEAFSSSVGGVFDDTALLDFSRDMVRAIRDEAGDRNHLINLGTIGVWTQAGSQLPYYGDLLECPTTGRGGCNDLAEAHDYSALAFHGTPAPTAVRAKVLGWHADDRDVRLSREERLKTDQYTQLPAPASGIAYERWGVRLTAPPGGAWSALIDDAVVVAGPHSRAYTFEAGTDGFTAVGGVLSHVRRGARTGSGALRLDVPASSVPTTVDVIAPQAPGAIAQLDVGVRANFTAPLEAPAGNTLVPYVHTATVVKRKPFVLGEMGMPASVPGAHPSGRSPSFGTDSCLVSKPRTMAERAAILREAASIHFDGDHGTSGFLVWDWKDPGQLSAAPNGAPIIDPTINCYSITPADPAAAVLRQLGEEAREDALPLPPPGPLPAYRPVIVPFGISAQGVVAARVTEGGDPVRGAEIVADGACRAGGVTDAHGVVRIPCARAAGDVVTLSAPGLPADPVRLP